MLWCHRDEVSSAAAASSTLHTCSRGPMRMARRRSLPQASPTSEAALKSATAPAGNVENGTKLYNAYGCYQCHGYSAQGGAAGPRLGPNPISFSAFARYTRQPTGQMPAYTSKLVSDSELADIYAFLQTIPKPPDPKNIPLLND